MACFCFTGRPTETSITPDAMQFDVLQVLRNVRLFNSLNNTELEELRLGLMERTFAAGRCLMRAGEMGTEFFIIVSGKCEVITGEGDKVAELEESDYCGEQGLLRSTVRNATVRAIVPTTTLCIDKRLFDSVLRGNVKFARRDAKRKAILSTFDENAETLGDTRKTQRQKMWLMDKIADNLMFSTLDEEKRLGAVDQMYLQEVPINTDLIQQGDADARTFYVVESGEFDVYVNEDHVATIPRGGCFGELALMYGTPRAATCRANQDSVVWCVDRSAFRAAITRMHKQQFQANIEFLRGVAILQPLLTRELALVDEAMMPCTYDEGDIIVKQGDDPDKFYIVKRGIATWSKKNPDGSVERGDIPAGGFFGELALLNDQPRAATVAAKTQLECLELTRRHFQELLGPLEDIMKRRADDMYHKKQENVVPRRRRANVCTLDELNVVGILGKGAFGVVSLVVDPGTSQSYALKAIKKHQIVELGQQSHILNEKRVMELLHNPFLVNLQGTYKDELRVYFLLDACLGGELFTILRKRRYFDEPASKFYAACVVEAFAYMHSQSIVYRDLKPENLVLDDRGYLKVTDFGFAKVVEDRTFTLCGTPDYLAPEIVTGQGHGKGVDWWTLGILIYEMLASFPPFFDDEPIETYKKIIKCRIKFPRYFSQEAKELIKGLLRSKPVKRLGVLRGGARNIRKHTWFSDFSWENLVSFKARPPIIPKVRGPDDIRNFDQVEEDDDADALPVAPEDDFDDEF